jgi:hypothetical protein
MKIGPNDEFQTVVGNEPMLPLLGTQAFEEIGVSLFPNPMQDFLTMHITQGNGIVSCLDLNGQTVFTQFVETGVNALEVSSLKAGVYFIQFAESTWKFIKL